MMRFRTRHAVAVGLGAALSAGAALAAPPAAPPGPPTFRAVLVGANEVPGPGDPDGTGSATVTIDLAKEQLCYTLMVGMVDGVTMAHIHKAPAGIFGNVVVPFAAPTTGSSNGCVTIRDDLAAQIVANPEGFYVNVHSEANPAGAVRGQLVKEGHAAAPAHAPAASAPSPAPAPPLPRLPPPQFQP